MICLKSRRSAVLNQTRSRSFFLPFPDLQWLALLPQLRPLLTNLKVLDWFARTLPKSQAADDQQYVGLTAVIDQLWRLWTESPTDGLARSHLLMKLATAEAETLSRGVPRTQLGHAEQHTLRGLEQSGLIRIRDDRVSLAHDLLGDWARLRVLVAEDATSTCTESRAASPRWQQAVRLFGQRLLETSARRPGTMAPIGRKRKGRIGLGRTSCATFSWMRCFRPPTQSNS